MHIKPIAGQHNTGYVLADIMYISLHRCKNYTSCVLAFSTPSLLRWQPRGAYRPFTSFRSGAIAASMFSEHLADASGTALMGLVKVWFQ